MRHHIPPPLRVVKTKPARHSDDRQGHHRPHIPVPQRPTHRLPPRDRPSRLVTRQIELAGKGKTDQRPEKKKKAPSQGSVPNECPARHSRILPDLSRPDSMKINSGVRAMINDE